MFSSAHHGAKKGLLKLFLVTVNITVNTFLVTVIVTVNLALNVTDKVFVTLTLTVLHFCPTPRYHPEEFFKLKRKARTEQLKAFANYLEHNWIVTNTWPPSCWIVYLRAIRTNNDVEGWHNGLNRRAQVG